MNSGPTGSSRNDESRRRPDSLSQLARRVERTYWARREMAKRLALRGTSWNAALVSLSLASVLAGAALLQQRDLYGPYGDTGMLLLGILTLVASLMVSTASYSDRARLAFDNYRALQRLSTELEENVLHGSGFRRRAAYRRFDRRYQDLLDSSSNHITADHARNFRSALRRGKSTDGTAQDRSDQEVLRLGKLVERRLSQAATFAMNLFPTVLIGVAVAVMIPTLVWLVSGN